MPNRKNKVSKSQAIRDVFEKNPQATAKEVVDGLAQKQIEVKPGLVYMVKGQLAQMKSHRRKKASRVARAGQKTGSADPIALIVKVKELAREAGGMDNLKTLISVLAD